MRKNKGLRAGDVLTPGAKSAGKAARPPFRPSFPCKTRLRKDIFKNKKNNRDIFSRRIQIFIQIRPKMSFYANKYLEFQMQVQFLFYYIFSDFWWSISWPGLVYFWKIVKKIEKFCNLR